jgi:putative lipoic acid-binding regulatory protein
MSDEKDTLLTFPCRFPIKMMGKDEPVFHEAALQIVERHAGKVSPDDIKIAPSRNGNFVSITITIDAASQQQLDDIYRDVSTNERIMVAL